MEAVAGGELGGGEEVRLDEAEDKGVERCAGMEELRELPILHAEGAAGDLHSGAHGAERRAKQRDAFGKTAARAEAYLHRMTVGHDGDERDHAGGGEMDKIRGVLRIEEDRIRDKRYGLERREQDVAIALGERLKQEIGGWDADSSPMSGSLPRRALGCLLGEQSKYFFSV